MAEDGVVRARERRELDAMLAGPRLGQWLALLEAPELGRDGLNPPIARLARVDHEERVRCFLDHRLGPRTELPEDDDSLFS